MKKESYRVYARYEFQISGARGTRFVDAIVVGDNRELKGFFQRDGIPSEEDANRLLDEHIESLKAAVGNKVYSYPKEKNAELYTLDEIILIKKSVEKSSFP